jgi:IS6 family transposase
MNNVAECEHGKLKRIIGATLGFKSMKTAYTTIIGSEVIKALHTQRPAGSFYFGSHLSEVHQMSRVFEMYGEIIGRKVCLQWCQIS